MKTTKKRKTTTVSCDESTRQFIAAEAERTGLLQRQVLAQMVEHYKRYATENCKKKDTVNEDLYNIEKKITAEVNRVIGFIKEQEKVYLKDILQQVRNNGYLVKKQISILEETIKDR